MHGFGKVQITCYGTYQQGYNLRSKQVPTKFAPQKDKSFAPIVHTGNKNLERKQVQPNMKVTTQKVNNFSYPFSLEYEISKIKIPIPLTK
jgi:hypothetical protein